MESLSTMEMLPIADINAGVPMHRSPRELPNLNLDWWVLALIICLGTYLVILPFCLCFWNTMRNTNKKKPQKSSKRHQKKRFDKLFSENDENFEDIDLEADDENCSHHDENQKNPTSKYSQPIGDDNDWKLSTSSLSTNSILQRTGSDASRSLLSQIMEKFQDEEYNQLEDDNQQLLANGANDHKTKKKKDDSTATESSGSLTSHSVEMQSSWGSTWLLAILESVTPVSPLRIQNAFQWQPRSHQVQAMIAHESKKSNGIPPVDAPLLISNKSPKINDENPQFDFGHMVEWEAAVPPSFVEMGPPTTTKNGDHEQESWFTYVWSIVAWNEESAVLVKLAANSAVLPLLQGLLQVMVIVVLGIGLQTADLIAYLLVTSFVGWTLNLVTAPLRQALVSLWPPMTDLERMFVGQAKASTASLDVESLTQCTAPSNMEKEHQLIGQYTQITILLQVAISMPFWIVWTLLMGPLLDWLLISDADLRARTMDFLYIFLVLHLVQGLHECLRALLSRAERGTVVSGLQLLQPTLTLLVVGIWAFVDDTVDVITFGLVQLELEVVFLVGTVGVPLYLGWLDTHYRSGLLGSCAIMDVSLVTRLVKTAAPTMIGNLLLGSTWEVLMILAGYLGTTEIIGWCLLRVLWDSSASWLDGVSFAASLRLETLILLNKTFEAKKSSFKSLLFVTILSLTVTVIMILGAPYIPSWLVTDSSLQQQLSDLFPFLGIGVFACSITTTVWQFLIAQGRHHIASFAAWISSTFITIPLAAVLSVHLLINLQGQFMTLVLGNMMLGSTFVCLVFTYDWDEVWKEVATMSSSTAMPSLHSVTAESTSFVSSRDTVRQQKARSSTSRQRMTDHNDDGSLGSESTDASQARSFHSGGGDSSWSVSSAISSAFSSTMSYSTSGFFNVNDEVCGPPARVQRIYSMASGVVPAKKLKKGRRSRSRQRSRQSFASSLPLSPLVEETSSAASSSTSVSSAGESQLVPGQANPKKKLIASASKTRKSLLGYRAYSELGRLSRKELRYKQRELLKLLSALKATQQYDIGRSKSHLIEELQWVLNESPDIFEVEHLEKVIELLRLDEDCRRGLWHPVRQYLPIQLQRMGLPKLLRQNILGAHHLKACMDKFVIENQFETNSLQAIDTFDDEQVHRTCEMPQLSCTPCFVLRE